MTFGKHINESVALGIILFVLFMFILPILPDVLIDKNGEKPYYLMRLIKFSIVALTIVYFSKFLDLSQDNFFFELTPEKYCEGGPYMWSSNPEKQKFCSKFSKADMAKYECPSGFVGAPIWRGGAGNQPAESNDQWKNTRCSTISKDYNDPQVL